MIFGKRSTMHLQKSTILASTRSLFNPRRMCHRVTVVILCVCLSVIELAATYLIYTLKIRHH